MFKPPKWISISLLLILAFIQSGTAESYRCSVTDEKCVFPFDYWGETYNECVDGVSGHWCNTDGSSAGSTGWAYCEVCPGDETTSTTTTVPSTTTTSTHAETTTTPRSDDTSSNTTTIQVSKTSTTTTTVQPIIPTTTINAPTTQSTSTNSPQSTTSTSLLLATDTHTTISVSTSPTTATKIKSPATSEVVVPPLLSMEDDSGTTIAEEDNDATTPRPTKKSTGFRAVTPDADEVFTTTKKSKDDVSDTMIVESIVGTTKLNDTTTVGANPISKTTTAFSTTVGTSQPTTAKVCTESEKACDFPFEYKGETYRTCINGYLYHWCYTDASIEEFSPCVPCDEATTSTSTKTSPTTTTTTTTTQTSRSPAGSTTTKQSSIAGAHSTVGTASTGAATTVKSAAPAKGRDLSGPPMSNADHDTTEIARQLTTTGKEDYVQEGSGEDTSNTKTVTIVVLVLCAAAAVVILVMVIVFIRRRRKPNQADLEKNGNSGESGEGLLSHNKNGNHKSINDGDSQEMKPLNPKPTDGNGDVDTGAGGDCDIMNEKKDDITANVTV